MSVAKKHYAVSSATGLLFLLILLSFFPSLDFRNSTILNLFLNTTLFFTIFWCCFSKTAIICLGLLYEVLSSGVLGMIYIKYILTYRMIEYLRINFKIHKYFLMSIVLMTCAASEITIKNLLNFHINYAEYFLILLINILFAIIVMEMKNSIHGEK